LSRVLNRDDAVLVVVDVQERLVPAIDKDLYARSLKNFKIMIESAGTLGLPILLTEQYPKGLGRTVPDVLQALEGKKYERIEKVSFSCARDEGFLAAVAKTVRRQVVLIGMETHVCVYQTVRGLVERRAAVHVPRDAVVSRTAANRDVGLGLMERSGAVLTSTEVLVFDALHRAGSEDFKALSKLVK
jgi:nicotinamidase-related amidase